MTHLLIVDIYTFSDFPEWRKAFGGATLDAGSNYFLLRGAPLMKLSLVDCCLFVDKFKPMYITTVDFSCMILEFSNMIFVSKDQARPKRHRGRPKLEFISSKVLPCKYFSFFLLLRQSMCSYLGFWQNKCEPHRGNNSHAGKKIVGSKTKTLWVSIMAWS